MAEAADVSLTAHEARAAGLDLWDGSRQYGKTLIYAEAGLETMAMVGMVALPETCSFLLLVSLPIWQEGRTASAAFRPLYLLSRPRGRGCGSPTPPAQARRQRGQERVLLRRQLDPHPGHGHLPRQRVHEQIAVAQLMTSACPRHPHQHRPDPGQKLRVMERLRDTGRGRHLLA